ncbi:hypothetical protein [Emticicia sp. W12TSBA100-4]|uniref:hypothetical protein n=1 Tax=Emticicia sp. W12TSBA100-4 TaxID=3160965 RepID=UPI0033062986
MAWTEQDSVELQYAIHGTCPDGWVICQFTGKARKGNAQSMDTYKKSRTTSQEQNEFARRINSLLKDNDLQK